MSQLAKRKRHLGEALMRTAICEAALQVLSDMGYGALTMDRVAEAAEVSKGTLYNYYADKDALTVAAIKSSFEPLRADLNRVFAELDYGPQSLIAAIRALLEHVDQRDALGRVLTSGGLTPAVDAVLRMHRNEILDQITEVFVRAADRGALRPTGADPRAMARLLILAIDGAIRERLRHPTTCPSLPEELGSFQEFLIAPWFLEQAE
jgi:AcrR family transcriptional regulator